MSQTCIGGDLELGSHLESQAGKWVPFGGSGFEADGVPPPPAGGGPYAPDPVGKNTKNQNQISDFSVFRFLFDCLDTAKLFTISKFCMIFVGLIPVMN